MLIRNKEKRKELSLSKTRFLVQTFNFLVPLSKWCVGLFYFSLYLGKGIATRKKKCELLVVILSVCSDITMFQVVYSIGVLFVSKKTWLGYILALEDSQ